MREPPALTRITPRVLRIDGYTGCGEICGTRPSALSFPFEIYTENSCRTFFVSARNFSILVHGRRIANRIVEVVAMEEGCSEVNALEGEIGTLECSVDELGSWEGVLYGFGSGMIFSFLVSRGMTKF